MEGVVGEVVRVEVVELLDVCLVVLDNLLLHEGLL
jgi:hypothetical protein